MKKLKIIFVLLFLVVFAGIGVACQDENVVKSISLSLSKTLSEQTITYSAGEYNILSGQSAKIDVVIKPDTFTVEDLEWTSSNTAIVYVYKGQISAVREGVAIVYAKYAKSNITASIKIRVNDEFPQITFSKMTKTLVYNGLDQKTSFKADQDSLKEIVYTYYDYQNPSLGEQSAEGFAIKNAGTYKVIAKYKDKPEKTNNVDVTITPYKLSLKASNYEYVYGDVEDWPEKLFSTSDLPSDILLEDNAQELLCGIGEDKDVEGGIGKFIETTSAQKNSNVGPYQVGVQIKFFDDYKNNYSDEVSVTLGKFDILKKDVVVVVEDQEITYGFDIASNKYKLYSYKEDYEYDLNNFSSEDELAHTQLVSGQVEYMSNINLGQASVYNGAQKVTELNVCLDGDGNVIPYSLKYENWISMTNNLNVKAFVNAKLKVNKRQITISPLASQQKSFLCEDAKIRYQIVQGNVLQKDQLLLNEFLFVNYDGVTDGSLIEPNSNSLKSAGEYFYIINNTKNTNYYFSLTEDAIKSDIPEENEDKIKFKVNPATLYLEFNDVEGFYKTFGDVPVNYYGDDCDFKLSIKSLKINNKEIVLQNGTMAIVSISQDFYFCASENFEENGNFVIRKKSDDSEILSFNFKSIQLSDRIGDDPVNKPEEVKEGFYCYYYINNADYSLETQRDNFDFLVAKTTTVNLKKINIVVTPTQAANKMSRIYDGTNLLPEFFGTKDYYSLSSVDVDLEKESCDLAEILKEYGTENDFDEDTCNMLIVNGVSSNVGNYQIVLANLDYKNGFEYYNFVLDATQTYYYQITPCELIITPDAGQEKVYSSADGEFTYTVSGVPVAVSTNANGVPSDVVVSGGLSRESGEDAYSGSNVGNADNYKNYKITLGSLSFGSNYTLVLDSNDVYFKITPREVIVLPYNYTITYGENVPDNIRFEEIIDDTNVDETILENPTYTGSFALDGSKIGNYYPVKLDGDDVIGYDIIRSTFNCSGNYYVNFQSGAKLTVNKKQVVLNITSKNVETTPQYTKYTNLSNDDLTSLGYSGYTADTFSISVSGIVEGSVNRGILFAIAETSSNSGIFVLDSTKDYVLYITTSGIDTTYCYELILGNDIVYVVNKTIIDLKIVNKLDNTLTSVTKVFDGTEMKNDFVLISLTSGYSVSASSQVTFKFLLNNVLQDYAQNVGTYVVTFDLVPNLSDPDNSDKIVITKTATSETFEFASITSQVGNCVLNITNVGALTINKTDMTYSASDFAFENSHTYGNENLTVDIKLKDGGDNPIFKAVDGSELELKQTGSLHYTLVGSYNFASYNVGTTPSIKVKVEPVDGNYNYAEIYVPLTISPRDINITTRGFSKMPASNVYDGSEKLFETIIIANDNGVPFVFNPPTWSFKRIKTVYGEGTTGSFKYYTYSAGALVGEEQSSPKIAASTFLETTIEGKEYVVLDSSYALVVDTNTENMLVDAGMYVMFITFSLDSNYNIIDVDGDEKGSSVKYAYFYEIQKSDQIGLTGWKEEFDYGEEFDFTNPNSLPFEFSTNPASLKNELEYVLKETVDTTKLNRGTYHVYLKLNNANYYLSITKEFKIKAIPVDVIVPTTNVFSYSEGRSPLFLQYLRVEYEQGGETVSEYYDSLNASFTLSYFATNDSFEIVGSELAYVPQNIGNYKLKVKYERDNYYGEGEYNYTIKKPQYTGSIAFDDYEFTYNFNTTAVEFYNNIINNMFSIDDLSLVESKTITCHVEGEGDIEILPTMTQNDFKKVYVGGVKVLTIVVRFVSGSNYENKTMNANLTIGRYELSQNVLAVHDAYSTYNYSGYPVYRYLSFNGIDALLPTPEQLIPYNNTTIENSNYKIVIENERASVFDKIGNLVFTLEYAYNVKNGASTNKAIRPGNYVASYNFVVGTSYNANKITTRFIQEEFEIQKIDTLYISFSNDTKEFGPDFVASLRNGDYVLRDLKVSSTPDGSNMKYTLDVNSSVGGYNIENGVCLVARFKQGGVVVSNAITTGTYQIELTFRSLNKETLKQYFNKVSFGGTVYNIDDLTISGGEYTQCLTKTLTIY